MEFIRGMRDKLDKYLDTKGQIEVTMDVSGAAVYDFCCFGIDKDNKLSDERYMIFYNQIQSPNNEVIFEEGNNKGKFVINLKKLPMNIEKLVFTVSIDGNGTMSEISSHKVLISQNGESYISLNLLGKDFSTEKAIISIEIYRKDGWRVAAVGNGFKGGIAALLSYFGGVEVDDEDTEEEFNDTKSESKQIHTEEYKNKQTVSTDYVKNNTITTAEQNVNSVNKESDVFNQRNTNGASTIVSFKYNPYTVESKILIDGSEVQPPNRLYDLKNERIQVWIDQLLPILIDICNDSSFQIDFYGLRLDYDDLYEIVKDYCTEHLEIEVYLNFTEAKGSEDRLKELQELFEEMQNDCPFEDLKTKQIQENFYNAISSEFEVSVIATMSSGKSTLINALLGRELMPSKNEACTATIAKIKDSNEGNVFTAEYRDRENRVLGKYDNLSLSDMDEMNSDVNTAYIDIEGNIPNIDSSGIKLVLVDTPGPNNSRTEEHKNHTYKVIKEKTKPMVLYVLNATQLQTNDDFTLLSTVAEAMKVGGKQSKDRFIFAVNKIDQFDPDKESVQDALNHVREYLKKFDIVNPNIFPTSAETAKVIRMQQNGEVLTKGQSKVLANSDFFIEENQLHLSEQASLSKNNLLQIRKSIDAAKESGDKYQEILMYTGVPAVEIAINEYLKKYAYTAKIKTAVDTFKKKVEEKDMHAKMLASINENENARNEIHSQLESIKMILEEGREAKKFRNKIEALDMMKDAKRKMRELRAKISKELNPSSNKGAMTTLEVQQLMMKLNNTVQHLQSDVKTELDNIIEDVIVDNANSIMKEYTDHIHELIQSGILENKEYSSSGSGIDFLEMDIPNAQEIINCYKYDEEYDTGEEEWVENTSKKWYKPWTWFEEKGHYRKIYANREMVDYSTVENEYLAPIIQSFNENLESAQITAQEEAEKFKVFFLKQLEELEIALKKKVEENEKLTQNQSNVESIIKKEKENMQWLESFLSRLEKVLEI
ncbi:TerD family protein [uncultured Clostridium sp.]|uniref:TerD family protein n=1 Tax=uncultured Clostridium sp. TaxID=59620 RepID=UPI0025F3F576|nr:TerD family protein [uncultured Clostridium sp.]